MSEETKKEGLPEGAPAEAAAPSPAPKKSNMMLFVIAGAAVVIIGGGAAFFMMKGKSSHEEKKAPEVQAPATPESLVNHNFPEFLINLKGEGGKQKFLKAVLIFELSAPTDVPVIEKLTPRITDAFQIYLRELRSDDVEGAGGMDRLREELLLRLNKITDPVKVNNILFKQFLIQ